MLVRTLLAFLFCLSGTWVWAADARTAPAAGSKAEEFAKINKEWTDLIANLGALKSEYATSNDAARKAEIRKQYNEGIEKAKAMEGKLVAAAESAYAEAPNADPKIVELLVATLCRLRACATITSRPSSSARCSWTTSVPTSTCRPWPAWPPICVNEYDLAESWLKAAKASGMLPKMSNEMQRDYLDYPETMDNTRPTGPRRRRFAMPKPRPTICRACS